MRADIACKYIYSHLLNTLKANEHGVLHDTDSEFLHDFRVAVRRTRAGLSQLKAVLPDDINARFSQFFSWLGQITSATRDLDVYLLNFPQYKASLPLAVREDLAPLHQFLMDKQQLAQRELAKKLRSAPYVDTLAEWETYLKADAPKHPNEAAAQLSIKQVAKRRIWKIYNRVLQEGDAINDQTAAEALHELRKTCKKLRYLMEFFQSIYPEHQIKKLISALKGLQDVLGDFQDYQVQENNLKIFSAEMQQQNTPVDTFLAIGMLIQDLDARKNSTRQHFNHQFLTFKQAENTDTFSALFAPSKHHAR
jgi:CHAD domain-containing protein